MAVTLVSAIQKKIKSFLRVCQIASRTNSYGALINFLIYRSPLGRLWARLNGYFFHQTTVMWFQDHGGVHSRATFLLNRLKRWFPQIKTVNMDLEFYAQNGDFVTRWRRKQISCDELFVLDSRSLPPKFQIPKPFNGTLLVKLWLNLPDKLVVKRRGLFSTMSTYIDYYEEGNFITTLHDYCQFAPDLGINYCCSGMIPAYCNDRSETFVVIHATKPGIKWGELEVALYNNQNEERRVKLPKLNPFEMRRFKVSELFADANEFLECNVGQVEVEGNFPQLLKRIAYGVLDKRSGAFSFDHAVYTVEPKIEGQGGTLTATQREKIPKGWFNPFFAIENDETTTSALLFHHKRDPVFKHVDVLLYDALGNLVVSEPSYGLLNQTEVLRIGIRDLLRKHGVPWPFMGHGEVLYHKDASYKTYPTTLEVCVEYITNGRFNSVIYGSAPWNGTQSFTNKHHLSGSRIVCNEFQTTYLAISNCSYEYKYNLTAHFTLNLLAGSEIKRQQSFTLEPNATFFRAIDDIFPDAREILFDCWGVGYVVTSDINCSYLTHSFLTQDRLSKVLSVEHSLRAVLPQRASVSEKLAATAS